MATKRPGGSARSTNERAKATEFLKKQHRGVEALFKKLESSDASTARKNLLNELAAQLKLHTALEEKIFYPAVRELGTKAEEMIIEAYEEHHVVDLVLAELPRVDPAADTFDAKMTVLKELVEHHVEEEEKEMFPMAERKLGVERSSEVRSQMESKAGSL